MSFIVKECIECGINMGMVSRNRMFCNNCRIEREEKRIRLRNAGIRKANRGRPRKDYTKDGVPRISMEVVKKLCSDCYAGQHVSVLEVARSKVPDGCDTAKFLDEKIEDLREQMAAYEGHTHEVRFYPEKEEYCIYAVYEDEKPTTTAVGVSHQNVEATDDEKE
jgi:hypothetical protein